VKRAALGFLLILPLITRAQEHVAPIDTLDIEPTGAAEPELLARMDSTGFLHYALPFEVEYIPGDDPPYLIKDRLEAVRQTVPLHYNERVHAFINYFTVRDREYTRMVARRRNIYFPLFEKYLAHYNMPDELKYLSIIESGLNPKAVSRARAVGLWQFMYATGKHYGLHVDWYVDQRMDPEKSTDAACRYLGDLYGMFNDWELALAAYNAGPGNVKKAIRRSGYKRSFWEIYPYLPRETRSYVPQYVAMIYTMNYLAEHNFSEYEIEKLLPYDTISVTNFLHFETFANLTGTCLEDMQRLNPSFQRNAVPDAVHSYTLKVPQFIKADFNRNRRAILDSASKVDRKAVQSLTQTFPGNTYGHNQVVYVVKSGDVLGSVAQRFRVRVSDIQQWNNLSGTTIRTGQRLIIWTKPVTGGQVTSTVPAKVSPQPMPGSKTYTVQQGDSLWTISRKFEGLTIERIKELNNLQSNTIQPGQTLILSN
jgi:membrane-bound lytic murein transglycosylase D